MIGNFNNLQRKEIKSDLVKNAFMKVLVSKEQGWDDHVMRVMEVEQDGYTPKHKHPWPHINFMIEGEGELMIDGVVTKVESGSYAYVPKDTIHQFRNTGKSTFKFICIVPETGHVY